MTLRLVVRNLSLFPCLGALLVLTHTATGQMLGIPNFSPSTIEYVPPLASAVLTRDPEQVGKLLATSESVDERVRAKDGARAGFTPLILASALSETKIARMLIQRGAKITSLDDFHRSAFWYAALNENVGLTTVLLEAPGARNVVDTADDDLKRAPLHLAVRGGDPKLVELLLKTGASPAQRDSLGDTPADYCNRRKTEACSPITH